METMGRVEVIDEIRMVYDDTKSGLNNIVWAPWFLLPTIESEIRAVRAGTFICYCDVGEKNLNFMLETKLRSHVLVGSF